MMIRSLLALTALAATAALAVPASAESVTVNLAGKSPAAAYAAITHAARAVCRVEVGMSIYDIYLRSDCVKSTVAATVAKVASPALTQYVANRDVMMQLASN